MNKYQSIIAEADEFFTLYAKAEKIIENFKNRSRIIMMGGGLTYFEIPADTKEINLLLNALDGA